MVLFLYLEIIDLDDYSDEYVIPATKVKKEKSDHIDNKGKLSMIILIFFSR